MPKSTLTPQEIEKRSGKVQLNKSQGNAIGRQVPTGIKLMSTSEKAIDLGEVAKDSNIILFIYPGNQVGLEYPELMGCTPETCSFRDAKSEFSALGIKIYGLSMQTAETQRAFAKQYGVNFEILSDPEGRLISALNISTWRTTDDAREIYPARETLYIKKGGQVQLHIKEISFGDIDTHIATLKEMIAG